MKKVLFISNHNPFASSYGAEQRSNILLKSFLQNACKVDVMYIGDHALCPTTLDENCSIVYWNQGAKWNISRYDNFKRLCLLKMFPKSNTLVSVVYDLIDKNAYDFIVCRYLPFAAMAGLDRFADKLILDIDDLPSQAMSAHLSRKTGLRALYQNLMLRRIDQETYWWISTSCASFLPNKEQAAQYKCICLPNIPILESGEIKSFKFSSNLLFIGKLDWRPNYEGVAHFVYNCWPSILAQFPSAHFIIAGKGLPQHLYDEFLKIQNVELLGFVDSLTEFYAKGNIVVSPIYTGAGTNIKVAEALSMGKACVLTPFSAKGYELILQDGKNAFIAACDVDFVAKTLKLLNSNLLCDSMMRKSHELAASCFGQSVVNKIIKSVIES